MRPNCFAPCAGYRSATPNKAGSEDRAFSSLNGAHGNSTIEIQIDGAQLRLRSGELLCEFERRRKVLLHRDMQPPATTMPYQRRTARLGSLRKFPAREMHLEPGPACTSPYFDDHATFRAVLPHSRVERRRFVPGTWGHGGAFREFLPFGQGFLFARVPPFEMGVKGVGRAQSGVNSCTPEHSWNALSDFRKRHNWMGITSSCVRELL